MNLPAGRRARLKTMTIPLPVHILSPFALTKEKRSCHDHIIRNEKDYKNIWLCLDSSVRLWEKDCFYKKESQ